MTRLTSCPKPQEALSDGEVISRVLSGDVELFELLMRRYNELVYRIGRGILRDNASAEDLAQDAWMRAYQNLRQYEGKATFSTWVSRIALYEAWSRARREQRSQSVMSHALAETSADDSPSPEAQAIHTEFRTRLEKAVDELPANYRIVFILRAVEGLSVRNTARALQLSEQSVKTRLHRARNLLRRELKDDSSDMVPRSFPFLATRCNRIVDAVLDRICGGENVALERPSPVSGSVRRARSRRTTGRESSGA